MARNILTRNTTTGRNNLVGIDTDFIRAGVPTIGNGVATLTVTFSSAVPSTSYAVFAVMQNTTDANPQFQPVTVTAKTTSGFTVKWNANTDSANYLLNYHTMPLV